MVEPEEVRGVVAALGPREPLPGFPRIGRPEPRLALVTDKVDVRALVAALVTTELCGSRTRPNLVLRPHLREALDRDEGRRLTRASAPVGFGKTTLLVEWLKDRSGDGRSVARVSLNAPTRSLHYLMGALRNVQDRLGGGCLDTQNCPVPDGC